MFIKIVSKLNFANSAHFTRKFAWARWSFLDTSYETYALHGVFDASRCMMLFGRKSVDPVYPESHQIYKIASCCTFGG